MTAFLRTLPGVGNIPVMAENEQRKTVSTVSRNYSIGLTIRKAPREKHPVHVTAVMSDTDAEARNACYSLWCRRDTFDRVYEKGMFEVEVYDASYNTKERFIDKVNRGLDPVPEGMEEVVEKAKEAASA